MSGACLPQNEPVNSLAAENAGRMVPAGPAPEDVSVRTEIDTRRMSALRKAVTRAHNYFLGVQHAAGCWVFDLEADTTITSEYILLQRFLQRPLAPERRRRMCRYILDKQLPDGGWPLFDIDGTADTSASVKAYFALKLSGEPTDSRAMERARTRIHALGGAAKVNVFTRFTLALFGQLPWRATPAMPIEIMLLPRWFFFHLSKISYWSRTVLVPLLILCSRRPVCALTQEEGVGELFPEPPATLRHIDTFERGAGLKNIFILLDRVLKVLLRYMPPPLHRRALHAAERWIRERMQGRGGLGAIFPAMANAVMALRVLGYPDNDPDFCRGLQAIDELLIDHDDRVMCQPCHSPIWDACISMNALLESGLDREHPALRACAGWLLDRQVFIKSDWSGKAPGLEPGGWAFQFENDFYPDVDDTPMVMMALLRAGALDDPEQRSRIDKALGWVVGMQSSDGGWASFDIDNTFLYLNNIPFADHGALVDPSTADVTARCVEMLSMLGYSPAFEPLARGIAFLKANQEPWGGWYGRWGVNYIYGTWSALSALRLAGEDLMQPCIRRAVRWLLSCQNADGGWGETCHSYADPALAGQGASTASQTAWALLGLMATGEINSPEVRRGIDYLLATQNRTGFWDEALFTGTGFPRVFYLRYHGYCRYFPLLALGAYMRLSTGQKTLQDEIRDRISDARANSAGDIGQCPPQ